MSFDALIQFSPFGLEAEMGGSVTIKSSGQTILGAQLALHLTGPTPWHAWGRAHIEVLGFSVTARFDERFGPEELPPPPPPVNVSTLLAAALVDAQNWTAQPPAGEGVVSLRSRQGELLAHPLGGSDVPPARRPARVDHHHYGSAPVEGSDRFEIGGVAIGPQQVAAADREEVRDDFAAAQFLAMSDAEKLARPSFEPFVSSAYGPLRDLRGGRARGGRGRRLRLRVHRG